MQQLHRLQRRTAELTSQASAPPAFPRHPFPEPQIPRRVLDERRPAVGVKRPSLTPTRTGEDSTIDGNDQPSVLGALDNQSPWDVCERTVRGQADRGDGSASAAVGAGADDRDRRAPGDGADLQRPGVPAAGDGTCRRGTRGRARSNIWVVLGRGHPCRARRARAPGASVGGEDVLLAAGEERSARRRRSRGSAADGSAARGVDRPTRLSGAARLGAPPWRSWSGCARA